MDESISGVNRNPKSKRSKITGLFYQTAYVVAYVIDCILAPIVIPLHTMWAKVSTPTAVSYSTLYDINRVMDTIIQVIYGIRIGWNAILFLLSLFVVLRFRKSFWLETVHTSWKERFISIACVAATVVIGSGALHVLEQVGLAKVKSVESHLVIVPAQILVGLWLASIVQRMRELLLAGNSMTRLVEMGFEKRETGTSKPPMSFSVALVSMVFN